MKLREDLRSGELSLSIFAADLYDVAMKKAKPVYQDPKEFFALTYPTFNLRELAKDVVARLNGKNEKAVRQLELTYGGGKTHALITLFHLVANPSALPKLPAVQEFIQHIGTQPARARIAVLAFDKLDVEKGMEVRSPEGDTRWLKHPWSVLAFQLAGPRGLELLHAEGLDAERESAPAENLLVELLDLPRAEKLSTLVLIDEVLMFAREKVGLDLVWRGRLANFFQYLTQAATKVDRCGIVASLLATDPAKSDTLGKELTQELYAIFRREREEGVQPVVKDDVAEVLRRRFFTPESIRNREPFRAHVVSALKGIADLDDQTRKEGPAAEERFLTSYPFHPDVTDVFYSKWTNLEGFQRTRGILRTYALALRDAERWDDSPLIAANVFLSPPGQEGVSEAARELTTVAATEGYEGKKQEWTGILEGELAKARDVQRDASSVKFREVEQAVFATFLHSQPIGQKALTRELLVVLGPTRPDRIDLEKALRHWADTSWFLDEAAIHDVEPGALPASWRLGSRPNLRQMHHDARTRVSPDLIDTKLLQEISRVRGLTAGASAAGATVHTLPERPRDIDDDGEFHFAVLGPKAASDFNRPAAEARRFIDETTAPDRPRVYRNAVVLVVPSRDGLEAVTTAVRDYLGWEEVREQLKGQELDPVRAETLNALLEAARKRIPDTIRQAYSVVVTVSNKNEVHAFRIAIADEPLFALVKADARSRIQETAISAEALLPGGPYDLWREGESSRRAKDLVGAFAQVPRLPKMLNREAILDTLVGGCRDGVLVLQLPRPDRSLRTFWRQSPDDAALKDPALEVLLPATAEIEEIRRELLSPNALPGLWEGPELRVENVLDYFAGGRIVKVSREGYEEPITIPKARKEVVETAIAEAVAGGKLWLTSDHASLLGEEVPPGLVTDDTMLQAPPAPIPPTDLLPEKVPEAWTDGEASALGLYAALSKQAGKNLPWATVRESVDGAYRIRLVERTEGSGPWPCDFADAGSVKLRVPAEVRPGPGPRPPAPPRPGVLVAEADLRPNEIQDLADRMGDLAKAAVGHDLKFHIRVELGGDQPPPDEMISKVNQSLEEVSSELKLAP